MFNWSDPNTYWLNITDIVLGVVTLACVVVVALAVFREVYARLFHRVAAASQTDAHTLALPELGLTMADGGQPIDRKKNTPKS